MEYTKSVLLEEMLKVSPMDLFIEWYNDAFIADPDLCNAMLLSTVGLSNIPSARVVLLKEVLDENFIFYTNYKSRKGREITVNPNVSLTFFWASLERQVRIQGICEKTSPLAADEYFASRSFESQVGAWVSDQSEKLNSRKELDDRFNELSEEFSGQEVPRPDFWGGFKVKPFEIEFWQGRPNRLNDRILYALKGNEWKTERLAP